jgi:N-acyl-D-amino-acid deacylase
MLDVVIRSGTVIDGSGRKGFRADVGIEGDRIAAVGDLGSVPAREVLDAQGRAVSPGFINIHAHDDLYVLRPDCRRLFEPYVLQGITTTVVSNCGWSPAPWFGNRNGHVLRGLLASMGIPYEEKPPWETQSDFHGWLASRELPMNFLPLAAHGPIRIAVMGEENRFSTPAELAEMKALVRQAMEAGCWGFSTGLTYFPGVYAHTDEIVELARVAADFGGRYVTHVRGHSSTYPLAVGEALEIGRRSGCGVQLSHVFCTPDLGRLATPLYHLVDAIEALNRIVPLPGMPNGVLRKALQQVDEALDQGQDVGMDFIPYVLGNTTVTQLFPPWANKGGTKRLVERLRDPAARARIRRDVETVRPRWPHWEEGSWPDNYVKFLGWHMIRILSVGSGRNRSMEGRRVVDLAREAGKDPFDFVADLTVEEEGAVSILFGLPPRPWTEKVFTAIQGHPALSVGADTVFSLYGSPPPSVAGCFPRILGHYVRDLGLYSLEEAVWRSTGLSASRFGLRDRGRIEKGAFADLVVFDPRTVRDRSTLEDPTAPPDGIEQVFLNGRRVVQDGRVVPDVAAGRLLLRT